MKIDIFDLNGNSFIDEFELKRVLKTFGQNMNSAGIQLLVTFKYSLFLFKYKFFNFFVFR